MSVVTMRSRLTETDIRALIKGPTEEIRASAAHKICHYVDGAPLSADQRAHAEAIVRMMAQDAAALVRRTLAIALKNSPQLPRDVALRLAADVDDIALPILQGSPSLTDEDLIEVLRAAPSSKQIAIASREQLSRELTGAIAAMAAPEAVEQALANDNAEFDESSLYVALQRFGERESLTQLMVRRRELPVGVVEKLISMVAGDVFDYLVNHHEVPPQTAIDLATGARERATMDLVEQAGLQRDLGRFAHQLNLHGRLTPSFIMRALCLGHMEFIEHAMSELSGLPHHRAWMLIHDAGPVGLKTLFDRTALPARLFPAFRAGLDVYHQIEREGAPEDRHVFRERMIQRVLTLFQSIPRDDLEYLLEKLDAVSVAPGRIAS